MPKCLLVYHGGGMPETPEAGEKAMAAWSAWYGRLGAAVEDDGWPAGKKYHTASSDGRLEDGGANPVSGYTVMQAEDYAAVSQHAAGNPMVVDRSGSVEVTKLIDTGKLPPKPAKPLRRFH